MKTILSIIIFCALVAFAQGQEVTKAAAQLEPKSGSTVTGTVTFTKVGDDIRVVADIQNLTPGKHGFHIHEKGDCSAPDASSAGAHFNPTMKHHGGPTSLDHHTGDLGNIEADASGKAHLDWKGKLSLTGKDSIIGKSVVVHEKEDDLKTDPSGNSGARLACGPILAAE
ncbi:MAG TPA: superoxide dismutase family protein [Chthoniobacterales bacterium]|jgi:Cu-Zn family superoxide dismutase|nr:superoxide dismutase family protein [Chthoniobacterales bacterium]